jgi:hypothetical protein
MVANGDSKVWFEIWKHFQAAADTHKEELFKSATWQCGLMAAALAYAVGEGMGGPSAVQGHSSTLMVGGLAGLLLARLTRLTVGEVGSHITSSWSNANRARRHVPELLAVLGPPADQPHLPGAARRLLRVVTAFELALVSVAALGATRLLGLW